MFSPKERIQRQVLHKDGEPLDLLGWADVFMSEYGLSFEEFRKIRIPTFYRLIFAMKKRYDKQNKGMKKPGRRGR